MTLSNYISSSPCNTNGDAMDSLLFYQFDIPSSNLIFVENESDLSVLKDFTQNVCDYSSQSASTMAAVNENSVLIGIDTETPPFHTPKITSLLQIAIRNEKGIEKVFVVDLFTLSKVRLSTQPDKDEENINIITTTNNKRKECSPMQPQRKNDLKNTSTLMSELDIILTPLFSSSTIIKVGQGLSQDFIQLHAAYPYMLAFQTLCSILETNKLHQILNPNIHYNISLKNLTRNYLHFDLDKSCQMSNWRHRPLSHRQIVYAACDALILLRLYDVMTCEIQDYYNYNNSYGNDDIISNHNDSNSNHDWNISSNGDTNSVPDYNCSNNMISKFYETNNNKGAVAFTVLDHVVTYSCHEKNNNNSSSARKKKRRQELAAIAISSSETTLGASVNLSNGNSNNNNDNNEDVIMRHVSSESDISSSTNDLVVNTNATTASLKKSKSTSLLLTSSSSSSSSSSSDTCSTDENVDNNNAIISDKGCDDEVEELPTYRKFYSFAERHWFQSEISNKTKNKHANKVFYHNNSSNIKCTTSDGDNNDKSVDKTTDIVADIHNTSATTTLNSPPHHTLPMNMGKRICFTSD